MCYMKNLEIPFIHSRWYELFQSQVCLEVLLTGFVLQASCRSAEDEFLDCCVECVFQQEMYLTLPSRYLFCMSGNSMLGK